jgi:hypothetical protein
MDIFLQKAHVEKKSKQIDKHFDVSFSTAFFVFLFPVFWRRRPGWSKQNSRAEGPPKNNRRTPRTFAKPEPPTHQRTFFGRFSARGVQKQPDPF